jgi:ubiquinol-cytochrome c reductase subunit 7
MNVLGPSLAPYIRSSRTLKKYVTPVAHWYADLMGYRKMGLKYDDLRTCLISSGMFNVLKLDSCRG